VQIRGQKTEHKEMINTDVINVLVQSSLLSIRLNIFINWHYQSRNYNTLFGLFVISLWYKKKSIPTLFIIVIFTLLLIYLYQK